MTTKASVYKCQLDAREHDMYWLNSSVDSFPCNNIIIYPQFKYFKSVMGLKEEGRQYDLIGMCFMVWFVLLLWQVFEKDTAEPFVSVNSHLKGPQYWQNTRERSHLHSPPTTQDATNPATSPCSKPKASNRRAQQIDQRPTATIKRHHF